MGELPDVWINEFFVNGMLRSGRRNDFHSLSERRGVKRFLKP
jgi:hypothetical protein